MKAELAKLSPQQREERARKERERKAKEEAGEECEDEDDKDDPCKVRSTWKLKKWVVGWVLFLLAGFLGIPAAQFAPLTITGPLQLSLVIFTIPFAVSTDTTLGLIA